MYCADCGHELPPESPVCESCGDPAVKRTVHHSEESSPGKLPAQIRERLKEFAEREPEMCLECGYVGPVGVLRRERPWWMHGAGLVVSITAGVIGLNILSLVIGPIGWIGFVIAGGIARMLGQAATVTYFVCPSCERILSDRQDHATRTRPQATNAKYPHGPSPLVVILITVLVVIMLILVIA